MLGNPLEARSHMKKLLSFVVPALLLAQTACAQVVYVPYRSIQKETRGIPAPAAGVVKTSLTGPGNDFVVKGSNLRRAHVELVVEPFALLSAIVPAATITDAQYARLINGLAKLDQGPTGLMSAEHWDVISGVLADDADAGIKKLADKKDAAVSDLDPLIDQILAHAASLERGVRLSVEMRAK